MGFEHNHQFEGAGCSDSCEKANMVTLLAILRFLPSSSSNFLPGNLGRSFLCGIEIGTSRSAKRVVAFDDLPYGAVRWSL